MTFFVVFALLAAAVLLQILSLSRAPLKLRVSFRRWK